MKFHSGVPEYPYLLRYLTFGAITKGKQSAFDHKYFSKKQFPASGCRSFQEQIDESIGTFHVKQGTIDCSLDLLLEQSDTLTFLVVKDGVVRYERNFGKATTSTPLLNFSITKTMVASIVAIAINEGLIKSINDPIGHYLHDVPDFVKHRTIQSLMNMETGIRYTTHRKPSSDMVRMWFHRDIRSLLKDLKPVEQCNRFLYNDLHLHLLVYMLEHVVGDVQSYFYSKLWKPLNPQSEAFWGLDSTASGFLKGDGGFVASARDLARFGMLYLNNGVADNQQILPFEWCNDMGKKSNSRMDKEYFDLYRQKGHAWYAQCFQYERTWYRNFWWHISQGKERNDFFAMGILGQFVYVSPSTNTVIVRQGNAWGINGWWPAILEQIANR